MWSNTIYNRIRERAQLSLAEYFVVSFPKSGRTWIKSFLASYIALLNQSPLSYEFCPVLRSKNNKDIPRIFFTHAKHKEESREESANFIKKLQNKKIVFVARNPTDILFSYYCRLNKRENNPVVKAMGYEQYVKSQAFGISRIVSFFNEWQACRSQFADYFLLRYESCREQPITEFIRLLQFLELPIREDLVALAVSQSVDTTRKIEEEGLVAERDLASDLDKGHLYFEADGGESADIKRYAGNKQMAENLMNSQLEGFLAQEMARLDPAYGY